jgi:hypothetical protein
MTETLKTTLFLIVGAVGIAMAFVFRPAPIHTAADDSGQPFYASFDPMEARSLEITRYPETAAAPVIFKAAQVAGVWRLPSHENYPADAEKQLGQAASALNDVMKGPRVSDRAADHENFGVVDPAAAASLGAGVRVRLADASDRTLADFIVGKPVKDKPELHYVRVPGKDAVYTAKIPVERFSTDFSAWIEKDLLKINTFDITAIHVNAYRIDEMKGSIELGELIELVSDPVTHQWSLKGMPEGETLDTARIEEVRSALADLKIVDVRRKPAGLSADLKSTEGIRLDDAAIESLQEKGYYFAVEGGLASNEGEMWISLKSGVQYVLRFGEVAATTSGEASSQSGGLNRYLFIMAQFDAALIPAPQLAPLPELPAAPSTSTAATQPDAAPQPNATQPADDAAQAALEEARQRIEESNQRRQAEHEQALADGRKKAAELNARFADWYYVISDDVYKRIKVRTADLLQAPADAAQPDAESTGVLAPNDPEALAEPD